jgi:hypothetical protein
MLVDPTGMTNEELAKEFERRNPYECFDACVEMAIDEIIEELRRIEAGEPPTESQQTDIAAIGSPMEPRG